MALHAQFSFEKAEPTSDARLRCHYHYFDEEQQLFLTLPHMMSHVKTAVPKKGHEEREKVFVVLRISLDKDKAFSPLHILSYFSFSLPEFPPKATFSSFHISTLSSCVFLSTQSQSKDPSFFSPSCTPKVIYGIIRVIWRPCKVNKELEPQRLIQTTSHPIVHL